jgi:hypothetical protein
MHCIINGTWAGSRVAHQQCLVNRIDLVHIHLGCMSTVVNALLPSQTLCLTLRHTLEAHLGWQIVVCAVPTARELLADGAGCRWCHKGACTPC